MISERIREEGLSEIDGKKYIALSFVSKDLMSYVRTELQNRLIKLKIPKEIGGITEFFEFNDTLDQSIKEINATINDITVDLNKVEETK